MVLQLAETALAACSIAQQPVSEGEARPFFLNDFRIVRQAHMCYSLSGGQILLKGCENMKEFVPKAKMSKKAQKKLAAERRGSWGFSPVTRKVDSKRSYNRKRISRTGYDDGREFFVWTASGTHRSAFTRSGARNHYPVIDKKTLIGYNSYNAVRSDNIILSEVNHCEIFHCLGFKRQQNRQHPV